MPREFYDTEIGMDQSEFVCRGERVSIPRKLPAKAVLINGTAEWAPDRHGL